MHSAQSSAAIPMLKNRRPARVESMTTRPCGCAGGAGLLPSTQGLPRRPPLAAARCWPAAPAALHASCLQRGQWQPVSCLPSNLQKLPEANASRLPARVTVVLPTVSVMVSPVMVSPPSHIATLTLLNTGFTADIQMGAALGAPEAMLLCLVDPILQRPCSHCSYCSSTACPPARRLAPGLVAADTHKNACSSCMPSPLSHHV